MFLIYQIGNQRVNLVASSVQGLAHSKSVAFNRPADALTGVSGDITYATPGRPLLKASKLKCDGSFICGASNTCLNVDQQLALLGANSGEIVPIIGVIPPECCTCQTCHGTGCSDCSSKPEAMWVLSYGMVTDISSNYKQDVNTRFGSGELPVSLTLEGTTYWEPLNDIEWQYWGRGKPTYPDITGTVEKHTHPYEPRYTGRPDSGFQRCVSNFMYEPANWVQAYSRVLSRRQRAVLTSTDYTTPTVTLSASTPLSYTVDVPYINWPAQPRSLYYFSNLPHTGNLTITVEALTLNGYAVSNTAVLDLDTLDGNSALVGGINPADAIIAGPIDGSFNGVYLAGGGTPLDMYVNWERTGQYPGELYVGRNTVTIEHSDSFNDIDCAWLHIFRRY